MLPPSGTQQEKPEKTLYCSTDSVKVAPLARVARAGAPPSEDATFRNRRTYTSRCGPFSSCTPALRCSRPAAARGPAVGRYGAPASSGAKELPHRSSYRCPAGAAQPAARQQTCGAGGGTGTRSALTLGACEAPTRAGTTRSRGATPGAAAVP